MTHWVSIFLKNVSKKDKQFQNIYLERDGKEAEEDVDIGEGSSDGNKGRLRCHDITFFVPKGKRVVSRTVGGS